MKELRVRRIEAGDLQAAEVPAWLDAKGITFQTVDVANWEAYPYVPEVRFRMAHDGQRLLLHFAVTEDSVRAVAAEDNGRVWEDACVEFFVQLDESRPEYYNFECNCAGRLLLAHGVRGSREQAPAEVLAGVRRWTSLGEAPFGERVGVCSWQAAEIIPLSAFFKDRVECLGGQTFRANFYKCGDLLPTPHFLSWTKIDLPEPCFHCPEFFGSIVLE